MKKSLKHILSILTCVTLTAALAFPVQAAGVSSIRMGSYKGNTLAVGERSGLILAPVGTEYTVTSSDPGTVAVEQVMGFWVAVGKTEGTAEIIAVDRAGARGSLTLTVGSGKDTAPSANEETANRQEDQDARQEIVRLVNQVRRENGAPELTVNAALMDAAQHCASLRVTYHQNKVECEAVAAAGYLSTLIDLDFLKKATPITEKNPEKSRKGLYFISDNFIRFWFRYVYPYKGELELDNQQIVLDELEKDFIQKFVAFSYEDVCKVIFASLCRSKAVDFVPSRIGSYWPGGINGDTEIDVMAADHQKKQVFAGECKYHNKPVDTTVYYELEEKVKKSSELRTAFPGYKILYGLFSKSGFTQRMLDQAEGRDDILLIQEAHIL